MNGVMKCWFEQEAKRPGSALDLDFVRAHVNGLTALRAHVQQYDWEVLERSSGVSRARMREFANLLAKAKSAVFVWSMGLTQHRFGTDNVSQVANLALLRGFIGRKYCGVMPIRGHSGVQGAGEMGADPFSLPGGDFVEQEVQRVEREWGFPVPRWQGDIVGVTLENARLDTAHPRKTKLFYTSGGNFLETMPDPAFIQECLEAVDVRVHQDIVLNTSTLCDAQEMVVVLPAMTRYEQPGGGTSTSTERMVYFSPEIDGPRIGEAKAEWQIYGALAARVKPAEAAAIQFADAAAIRAEIARVAPNYKGIERLRERGDVFQWGGAWLCEAGSCPTPDGRGQLVPAELPELRKAEGHFLVTTRRGKQFNSMIYAQRDPFNGADRDAVLLAASDAAALGVRDGEALVVYNRHGVLHGRAKLVNVKPGNIEVHWPEGNGLLPKGVYEPHAGIPEYNTAVIVEKAELFHAQKDIRYAEKRLAELELDAPE